MPEEEELSEKGKYQRTYMMKFIDGLKTYARKRLGEPIKTIEDTINNITAKKAFEREFPEKFPEDAIVTDLDVNNMKRLGDFEKDDLNKVSFQSYDGYNFADDFIYEF